MPEVVFATCPSCKGDKFRYFDKHPDGEYPECRFECQGCGRELGQLELQGIEWLEVPF